MTALPASAEAVSAVLAKAQPVGDGFKPYTWAATVSEVAERHGLPVSSVLKFDQNTAPLPGVPQVPLAESMARLNEYPEGAYSALRSAAAAYVGVRPENVVVGAGADDLILLLAQVFLGRGASASIVPPTYSLYRIANRLRAADTVTGDAAADLHWRCNPNNPTGAVVEPEQLVDLARSRPGEIVVVDEAYVEFGARSAAPWVDELPNLVVLRTLSKAFGFASLRVGYAVAHPETASLLDNRRAPAPVSGPAARIATAALRDPRLTGLDATIAERERVRGSLAAAGYDCPPAFGNFVWLATTDPLAERLEEQGIVVRGFREGIRITMRRPSENDVLLRALGAEPGAPTGREATVIRTTTETALRISLGLDGTGRARVVTGIGFLDHLLTLWAFHGGFDLELVAGGDLEVDEHHLVEDVLAALGSAVGEALGGREGVARYGSVVLPMDESRAVAAVDLVRRPHAEIELSFAGDRVGALATSLLAHALERFVIEAGCTVHVEASGTDDHHVAEAAFKALGQALRQAVAPGGVGIRSTKGAA
jgi:histidinol-phosphate aminotransferase/imidazoleglycerol-phosphate dehydratase/histidinol-phosphatase